ncbi:MAG: isoprenylcysteine carboxylmethyltransferase family protein [Candidatus Omnitrophica bacterium]|nr:isoprenylcysteine carboxylmethyltransferase family protein [Candidatus Omnitrophota bacterium]
MKQRIKIHGLLIFFSVLAIIVFPKVFLRLGHPTFSDYLLSTLGIAFVLLGQIFRLSSRGFKSSQSKNGGALVEGGSYSLVRNPMYLGIFLIGLGLVMMLFKWWAIAIFLIFFVLIYIRLIFQEEKKLLQVFPGVYQAYRAKVPALIPSFKMLAKTEVSVYLPLKFSWIEREIGSISAVLSFAILVRSWENFIGGGRIFCIQRLVVLLMMIILAIGLAAYLIKKTNENTKSL